MNYSNLHSMLFIFHIITLVFAANNSDVKLRFFVTGNGFHRSFTFEIDTGDFHGENCYMGLYLNLPSALYINVDELAEIRRSKNSLVCSEGETDIELFAEKSQGQNFSACSAIEKGSGISSFSIPIHQRYRYPTLNGNYANVKLPEPKILRSCTSPVKRFETSEVQLCSPCSELAKNWQELPYKLENRTYIWQIPVGETSDYEIVTFVTLLTTALGAAFLLKVLWETKVSSEKKDWKQK